MIRERAKRPVLGRHAIGIAATLGIGFAGGLTVVAQPTVQSSNGLIDGLRACRGLSGESERVSCYDANVDALLRALDADEVRMIDREEVRKTRRQLFGLPMPEIDILKPDEKSKTEEQNALFETTVASARQIGRGSWRLTTVEGAVWEINNPPRRLEPIMAGDKVVFKKASLGYYFIRINRQLGVKGRRIS